MQSSNRHRLLAVLAAFIVAGLVVAAVISGYRAESPPADMLEPELRMPTGKPLLEPDRPDLIGDPGIQSEDEDEGDNQDE